MSREPDPESMEPCLGCAAPYPIDEMHDCHCGACAAAALGEFS